MILGDGYNNHSLCFVHRIHLMILSNGDLQHQVLMTWSAILYRGCFTIPKYCYKIILVAQVVFSSLNFVQNKFLFQFIPPNNYKNLDKPSRINYFDQPLIFYSSYYIIDHEIAYFRLFFFYMMSPTILNKFVTPDF